MRSCVPANASVDFFLSLSDHSCLLIVGVEGYCCTWSHSLTRTHSVWLPWMRDRPVAEAPNCTTQHSQKTDILAPVGRCGFLVKHLSCVEKETKLASFIKENLLLFCTINCSLVSAFTWYLIAGGIDQTQLVPTWYSPTSLRRVISLLKCLVGFKVLLCMM